MPILDTGTLTQSIYLPASVNHQVYCGLDSCVTVEVLSELQKIGNAPPEIYSFERALQAPYLEIMLRGFAVDQAARVRAADLLRSRIAKLQGVLDQLAFAVWQKSLNPRSPIQLRDFFYHSMRLPEVWISQKGQRKLSTNREALEKLDQYLYARPFVAAILAIRDLANQLNVFETEIDSDGRMRTSYNIAGTETGRPSSSSNAFGTGGNLQNIAPALRYVFVADPGYKLGVIDLEQVEARDVGFFIGCLFEDWDYLDACESGDLHTNNAKRVWSELSWSGDGKRDRALADQLFYRDFTYRDMAKRGSHLSNYMGTAWTASRALKVPQQVMEEFQARYCKGRLGSSGVEAIQPAFPGIPRWWNWIATELQVRGWLETPFGRRRHFFGRHDSDETLREAIAFLPQSTTADRMNLGLWRVWKSMSELQMLAQTYDSITFQYREGSDEDNLIAEALELIRVELLANNGRSYIVPGEAKIGWNWGNRVTQEDVDRATKAGKRAPRLNLDGLAKWSPNSSDKRARISGLQRRV